MEPLPASGILIEAEAFEDYGGWIMDSQFELVMGSPYLLAHGNGVPVPDAMTTCRIAESGRYNIWVRAKDWVPEYHPGQFHLLVSDIVLGPFGANDEDWNWERGGCLDLSAGTIRLTLRDLTGFCGRCDAIFLSREDVPPPNLVNDKSRSWRKRLLGIPEEPESVDDVFDVVIVGGGFVGSAAALTAARLGSRVALVQDRPVLGGNASVEIGLSPRGEWGPLVKEINRRHENGDLVVADLLAAEKTAKVFLNFTVFDATTRGSKIASVDAREAGSGREIRLHAPTFIDCSGKALFGQFSRAETLFGQESRAQYGESLAPSKGDQMHHGNTLFFRTGDSPDGSPVSFPDVPWAKVVSKDYADLGGQLITPGYENGPGPKVLPPDHKPDPKVHPKMRRANTHYWEYGQWLDPYTQAEHIRDHLLQAIYGTFANVKELEPEKHKALQFEWVAFVPGQGEFRRYKGPMILTENDVRSHRELEDIVCQNGAAFCLHYPDDPDTGYDFRLKHWIWDLRDEKPFGIPFRCLYSVNITNLMMAGKHISVSHVAGSCTKLMGNGAQHAIAVGAAAHLCSKHNVVPSQIYEHYIWDLQKLVAEVNSPMKSAACL